MPSFGSQSLSNRGTLHPKLKELVDEAIAIVDFSIIWGHRDEAAQNAAFDSGSSKKKWPYSRHNVLPSRAVDIIPYPTGWRDLPQFYRLAGVIQALAYKLDLSIRWGGDWDSDGDFSDQLFNDLAHFELGENE